MGETDDLVEPHSILKEKDPELIENNNDKSKSLEEIAKTEENKNLDDKIGKNKKE